MGLIVRAVFHVANNGILSGAGRVPLVIVDVDSGLEKNVPINKVASTPLVIRTPSGGAHFWFRWTEQRSENLQKRGLSIDIKGRGGLVNAPPSRRPDSGNVSRSATASRALCAGFRETRLTLRPDLVRR